MMPNISVDIDVLHALIEDADELSARIGPDGLQRIRKELMAEIREVRRDTGAEPASWLYYERDKRIDMNDLSLEAKISSVTDAGGTAEDGEE